ncbi:aldehyde dehydrogenase family protein [Beduini massiliensis]|uniref:aldehyde dehydrogenase family protein n=1 Tax=Beduini massiliensis TaxID=1585974 RepID=UPI00059AA020|nr:aldehyde dehydrogenase family protein [Beduini massiliensis]
MQDIDKIIALQNEYFLSQATKSYTFRKKQLKTLYKIISDNTKKIEEALYQDLGKPAFEAYSTEIGFVLNSITYTLRHLKRWMKPKKYLSPIFLFGSYDAITYVPYGISLIIGPFNYPFQLVIEPLIGAIAAGNTCIVKPSENTPCTADLLAQLLQDNFEERYIACVNGDKEVTIALTHSPIQHIFFTGSIPVGKSIMKAASERLIPVTLELGGKSPVVIDETADVKDAAKKIVWGKALNAGQTCIAPDYLIIHEHQKDAFIDAWSTYANQFKGHMAKIVNTHHFDRLIQPLDTAIIYSGGTYDREHLQIELTLVAGNESTYMEEEIFGPILPLVTYRDFSEIVPMIQKHPNPLAFYIFSNNQQHIRDLQSRVAFGGGCVNDTINHLISHKVPFGGVSTSGIGQYHGKDSFITFSHKQTIHHRFLKKDIVSLYPPYSKTLYQLVRKIMR